jgi:hypothetical protein
LTRKLSVSLCVFVRRQFVQNILILFGYFLQSICILLMVNLLWIGGLKKKNPVF